MSTQQTEEEITIFARVGDFNGFAKADTSGNIQELSTFVPERGKFRFRKVSDQEGTIYLANIKGLAVGDVVKKAVDEDQICTAGFYEAARIMAERLIIRDRFIFNGSTASIELNGQHVMVPPIDYQVDVFHRFDGRECEWVKIDIEVNRLMDAIRSMGADAEGLELDIKISHLPFLPQEAFIVSDSNTPEQKALVKKIWEEYSQNPNGGPMQAVAPSISQGEQTQSPQPVVRPQQSNTNAEGNNGGENNV